jgi:hypothetical protein
MDGCCPSSLHVLPYALEGTAVVGKRHAAPQADPSLLGTLTLSATLLLETTAPADHIPLNVGPHTTCRQATYDTRCPYHGTRLE